MKNIRIKEIPNLQSEGLLRVSDVLKFIPVSRSHWWQGVKEGRYPQPIKLSERVTVWRATDIVALINDGSCSRILSRGGQQ